jgi:hypothetical protein
MNKFSKNLIKSLGEAADHREGRASSVRVHVVEVPDVRTGGGRSRRNRASDQKDKCRLQGIAAALGELARTHMEPDLAAMVLDSLGVTVAELEAAGADPYDLEALCSSS